MAYCNILKYSKLLQSKTKKNETEIRSRTFPITGQNKISAHYLNKQEATPNFIKPFTVRQEDPT